MIEILFLYLFLIFFMSLKLSSQGNERTVSGLFTTDDGKRIQHERRTMFLHYSEDSLRARRGLVRGTGTLHQARKDGWVRSEKMFYFLICYVFLGEFTSLSGITNVFLTGGDDAHFHPEQL